MFHISKKCGKNASETLSDLVFLFLTLSKLFRKTVLVIKSLFYLFWHWFITLSYKLKEVPS